MWDRSSTWVFKGSGCEPGCEPGIIPSSWGYPNNSLDASFLGKIPSFEMDDWGPGPIGRNLHMRFKKQPLGMRAENSSLWQFLGQMEDQFMEFEVTKTVMWGLGLCKNPWTAGYDAGTTGQNSTTPSSIHALNQNLFFQLKSQL